MCGTCGCRNDNKGPVLTDLSSLSHEEMHRLGIEHNHEHHHVYSHEHTAIAENAGHIEVERAILNKNQLQAERNRGYFDAKNIFVFNMVSSPGSGKTAILEKTLYEIGAEYPCYVIEGDQQTINDALRIRKTKTPVIQVNTGQGCHLESDMISEAVHKLSPKENSILFIENVGNLVCPSMFDLGEDFRIVIISVTEGDDKPLKYPDAFYSSQVCIINKIDLLPYVDFNVDKVKEFASKINPDLQFFEMSATTLEGMGDWISWLKSKAK